MALCQPPWNSSCQFNNTNSTTPVDNRPLPFYVFLILQASITIVGNGLLTWLFFTQRKLRTKQNFFIISLSFSDLLIGFAVLPCEYCHWKAERLIHDENCAVFCGSIISFNMAASVINLVMIGADRYLAVEKPFLYEKIFSMKRALIVIATGWCLAIIISVLPFSWEMLPPSTLGEKMKHLINVIFSGSMFSVTLLSGVMLFVFYRKIIATVRSKVPDSERHSTGIKVCILCTILFFVCWIPSTITEILIQCEVNVPHGIGDGSYFILMLGPCLDPVLYAYYRKDFRGCLMVWCKEKWAPLRNCYNTILPKNNSSQNVYSESKLSIELSTLLTKSSDIVSTTKC